MERTELITKRLRQATPAQIGRVREILLKHAYTIGTDKAYRGIDVPLAALDAGDYENFTLQGYLNDEELDKALN